MVDSSISETLRLFWEAKIRAYIQTRAKRFYNGIILECYEKHIVFLDDKLGDFPILIEDITTLEKSRRIK